MKNLDKCSPEFQDYAIREVEQVLAVFRENIHEAETPEQLVYSFNTHITKQVLDKIKEGDINSAMLCVTTYTSHLAVVCILLNELREDKSIVSPEDFNRNN